MPSFNRLGEEVWVVEIPDLESLMLFVKRENQDDDKVILDFNVNENDADGGGVLYGLEVYDDYRE